MNFNQAFQILIEHEGGYSDNPLDPGNWTGGKVGEGELKGTKYGIAANTYPALDIKNLSVHQVKEIYKRDYWNRLKLDQLPDEIKLSLFDTAVNLGVFRAIVLLQRALGVKEDGKLGPITINSAKLVNGYLLNKKLNGHRLLFITSLKTWQTFSKGWAVRIATNLIEN